MKWGDGISSFMIKLGRVYSGQYLDDIKHGYGEMQYEDGRIYRG